MTWGHIWIKNTRCRNFCHRISQTEAKEHIKAGVLNFLRDHVLQGISKMIQQSLRTFCNQNLKKWTQSTISNCTYYSFRTHKILGINTLKLAAGSLAADLPWITKRLEELIVPKISYRSTLNAAKLIEYLLIKLILISCSQM